jgi:hypothetical protein
MNTILTCIEDCIIHDNTDNCFKNVYAGEKIIATSIRNDSSSGATDYVEIITDEDVSITILKTTLFTRFKHSNKFTIERK